MAWREKGIPVQPSQMQRILDSIDNVLGNDINLMKNGRQDQEFCKSWKPTWRAIVSLESPIKEYKYKYANKHEQNRVSEV